MNFKNRIVGTCTLGVFLFFNAASVIAEPDRDITFYLNLLPHRQTGIGATQYDAVREYVLDGFVDKSSFKFAPIKRSRQNFFKNKNSCLFPTNITATQKLAKGTDLKFISTIPFDIVSFRLYTAQKSLRTQSVDNFKPNRIGYIRGTAALPLFGEKSKEFVPIASEKQLIQMLELNRLDAFLGHHPDTDLALDAFNKKGTLFVNPSAVKGLKFPISIVCHRTKQMEELITVLNPRIIDLHRTGKLREMLGTYADLPNISNLVSTDPSTNVDSKP